ncbi:MULTISPECIES: alpha/beta hydrolase family protein [unclassified Luteococcus]|uniref:alpha/beta hydrolase family protein n=1 Tax=unclassified Luteococcus TaxID=2639923 RepID=UPI00313F1256
MTSTTNAPCGSWPSPVTIEAMLASGLGLSAVGVDGQDVYWLESRPEEDGRSTLVRHRAAEDGEAERTEITPAPGNVRGRVQEYGGGTWQARDGIVAWTNDADRAVHVVEHGTDRAITPADPRVCFGDLRVAPQLRRVIAVREDHREETLDTEGEPETTIVALDLDSGNEDFGTVLVRGANFYVHPALGADDRLAWVEWDHPNMPWDGSRLMVGQLQGDAVMEAQQVAGDDAVSAVHPVWCGDGCLYFLSDQSGFWNPWAWNGDSIRQLLIRETDFCRPVWVLGSDEYALLDGHTLLLRAYVDGAAQLGVLDARTGDYRELGERLADVDAIAAGPAGAFAVVRHAERESEVVRIDVASGALETVKPAADRAPDPAWVSVPQPLWFDGKHGRAHTWYYPPTNPGHRPMDGELPPVIVNTHGGPTAMAPGNYRTDFQFWTSRGFAVLDVNYSGSAGFGRDYRNRLYGNWGVADVDDCVDAVRAVVARGLADPKRVIIQGGSAGGYTTLQALVSSDVFAAGVSRYGIGDLETLVTDTHKFESRYPFRIVGPYPEARELYLERSPIHHVDRLSSPMLILQGLEDKVVPPNQAEAMADAVRDKQLPVALIMFEGEGHGFRKQATRRAVVQAQLSFFSQLFGFTPADEVPRLEIENL